MPDEKLGDQVGVRLPHDLFARILAQAHRDKIKPSALARRLIEWSLPRCEEAGHIYTLDNSDETPKK